MKHPHARQYVIELDGATYRFSGNRLEKIDALGDVSDTCDLWVVSDLENALTRKMTVNAPVRYAEIIARKTMQESGEFDEPVSLITHWKNKVDRTTTDIFFTALPTRLYTRYRELSKQRENTVLLFPLFVVLEGVVKRMAGREHLAVFFHHNRFVDILIGNTNSITYANRCAAVDESQAQSAALWDMVRADLERAEEESNLPINRMLFLNWIDTDSAPAWLRDEKKTLLSIEKRTIFFGPEQRNASFLQAMSMQSALRSHAPAWEKLLYGVQRSLPALNLVFALAVLFFLGAYLWCDYQGGKLTRQVAVLKGRAAAMHRQVPFEKIPYEEVLSFVGDLEVYRRTPGFRRVVNDVSEAVPKGVSIQVLKADYSHDAVHMEIFGRADASFDDAYRGFQGLANILRQKGYHVDDTRFDTAIRRSEFLMTLTRKFDED